MFYKMSHHVSSFQAFTKEANLILKPSRQTLKCDIVGGYSPIGSTHKSINQQKRGNGDDVISYLSRDMSITGVYPFFVFSLKVPLGCWLFVVVLNSRHSYSRRWRTSYVFSFRWFR